jgi:hypothetical protein
LGQRINPSDAGLDAVADGSIDQPILAAKRNDRLGTGEDQGLQARSSPAARDNR